MSTRPLYDDSIPGITFLPLAQYNSTAVASGTLSAAQIAGAQDCYLTQSGATALTLPTAAQIFQLLQQASPNIGPFPVLPIVYWLRILNTNAGTLTLTAGTGITINGPATLATNTFRDYVVTVTGLATATFQSVGVGTAP